MLFSSLGRPLKVISSVDIINETIKFLIAEKFIKVTVHVGTDQNIEIGIFAPLNIY